MTRYLCSHCETCARPQAAHWTRIEPVARFIDIDDSSTVTDNIPSVTNNGCVLIDEIAYLAAQTHRVHRHSI